MFMRAAKNQIQKSLMKQYSNICPCIKREREKEKYTKQHKKEGRKLIVKSETLKLFGIIKI